jgi:hypothetical protein
MPKPGSAKLSPRNHVFVRAKHFGGFVPFVAADPFAGDAARAEVVVLVGDQKTVDGPGLGGVVSVDCKLIQRTGCCDVGAADQTELVDVYQITLGDLLVNTCRPVMSGRLPDITIRPFGP